MAYDALTSDDVDANSPADTTLWTKVKDCLDWLRGAFDASTGHTHTGAANDAPPVITQMEVGSFTRNMTYASSTQEIDLSGGGFQPSAIIFFSNEALTREASWGVDDGTTGEGVFDDVATANTYAVHSTRSIYAIQSVGNSYAGVVNSFDADGFTIGWTKYGSPSGTLMVYFLAIR